MITRYHLTILLLLCCNGLTAAESEPQIRNVLFIVSDDLKASALGCYGNEVCQTPNLDRLAKRGMVFEHAYCQGLACAPSRPSFMHSAYPGFKGQKAISIGEHLQRHGLYTARVGKIYHMRVPGHIIPGANGDDVAACWTERYNSAGKEAHTPGDYACLNKNIFTTELEGRESTGMPNRMFVTVSYDGDGSDQPDHKTATKTIELLRKHKDKPFFIAAGFIRPHYPMVQPKPYFDRYPWKELTLPQQVAGDVDDIPPAGRSGSTSTRTGIARFPHNQKRMWQGYYASVTFMDDQVGRVLDELDRLGLRDSTAVIFTSDHGYHLGEHGFWQKSNLHEEVVRVPLVISAPGMKVGRTNSFVELVDFYPTCTELLGLATPGKVTGQSLVPILNDPAATVRDNTALSMNPGKRAFGLRGDGWAYMRYGDGTQEELYDMKTDPHQFTNVARAPKYAELLNQARARLRARLSDDDR